MSKAKDTYTKILEFSMNVEQALDLFGLKQSEVTPEKVKSTYRKLSLKNHPDRGGDKDKMTLVNVAFDLLKNAKAIAPTVDRSDWKAKYKEAGKFVLKDLKNKFDYKAFVNYLNKQSEMEFAYEVSKELPRPGDNDPNGAGFNIEFFVPDKTTTFEMHLYVNLLDIVHNNGGLGVGDISYPLMTTSYGFHNNKKQKLSQNDWKLPKQSGYSTNDHSVLREPEKVFPKAKLKKIFSGASNKRAFKKRDMFLALQKRLDAHVNGEFVYIPIGSDIHSLLIYRSVFMRMPAWGVNGIYEKHRRVSQGPIVTMAESEETLEFFVKLQKSVKNLKGDKLINKVNSIIEDYKKKLRG
jgi:curved DNA-binding protein CbpA